MNPPELSEPFFAVGNAALLVATYPMIKEAWKNRKSLTGFSFKGSSLTFGACMFIATGYMSLGSWVNVALIAPTILFWGTVSWFCRKGDTT